MAYQYDPDARYAKTHDWARVEGDPSAGSGAVLVVCGITDYAQHELSDVVYVELPEVGETVTQGEVYGTVESVKAAEDVYAPVSGEVVEVNEALEDAPELLNEDPYGKAWIIKVRPSDLSELDNLMDASAYEAYLKELEEKGGH